MLKYFYITIFLIPTSIAFSQTEIKGFITGNENGKALGGISVAVQEHGTSGMLSYVITDDKGSYKLNFKSTSDSVLISLTGFNIKKEIHRIQNRSQTLDFKLSAQAINLKEVKITPPKIRQIGDTLNYLVDGYLDPNDRSIGDVLKKMPGIEVKKNGAILVNNKPINKFYIENMDLLQGRYGIATNNINAKDVASVQVLENHQPIKALRNKVWSDEAAINLKLKDSAKGTLTANGMLGAGLSPFLWNNELFSMYFAKGRQNVNTYKGNNSGDDVSQELTSFYSNDANRLSDYSWMTVQSPSSPAISQKRYLFNRANSLSVNNLWSLGKDFQLNANINYLNDRQEKDSYSRSTYYLPGDSLLTIEEKLSSKSHVNQAEAEIQLNSNNDKFYLNNLLKISGKWNSTDGNVLSAADTIDQHLDHPSYKLTNTFQWVQNKSNSTLEVYSFNGYSRIPQSLKIHPVLYADLFEPDRDWSSMQQNLTRNIFQSHNYISWQTQTGKWKQNYRMTLKAEIQHLDSELFSETQNGGRINTPDSLRNDLQWNRYEWIFTPLYTYQHHRFRASMSFPVSYNLLHMNDRIFSGKQNHTRLFFNPAVNLKYEFDAYWDAYATASYNNKPGEIDNGYAGYIMRSYRNLLRNDGNLLEQQSQSYNASLNYKNPIHAFFGNLRAGYFNTKSNLLFGSDYHGILSVRQTRSIPNHTEGFHVEEYLSKGIDAIASTITLGTSFNNSQSAQIIQNEIIRYKNNSYQISPGISTRIRSWSSFSYRFTFTENTNKVQNDVSNFKPIRTTSQDARLNLFPLKRLTINLGYEYFYNSAIASGNRTMTFLDAGAKYKWKELEFILSYTNILNAKEYVSASYSDISTYYYAYDLRPAEILLKVRFKIKGK
ncbi:MAG: hypothetical protein LBU57_01005 [Dysgonamonadaceae bacterium]|nr:hypothetical protein [Dysgonamonadaceae bacterium]